MNTTGIHPLDPEDRHRLTAAEGWLELGSPAEAHEELGRIQAASRGHPDVLHVRWSISAKLKHWEVAVVLGEALVRLTPQDPFGWIHRSFALHELKRTQEAWDTLVPAVSKFPTESVIPYNLACYACQLGNLPQARACIRKAMTIAGAKRIRQMASTDADLRPIWHEIGRLESESGHSL